MRVANLAIGLVFNSIYSFFGANYVIKHGFTLGQKLDSPTPIDKVMTDWINLGIAAMLLMGAPNVILNIIMMLKEA